MNFLNAVLGKKKSSIFAEKVCSSCSLVNPEWDTLCKDVEFYIIKEVCFNERINFIASLRLVCKRFKYLVDSLTFRIMKYKNRKNFQSKVVCRGFNTLPKHVNIVVMVRFGKAGSVNLYRKEKICPENYSICDVYAQNCTHKKMFFTVKYRLHKQDYELLYDDHNYPNKLLDLLAEKYHHCKQGDGELVKDRYPNRYKEFNEIWEYITHKSNYNPFTKENDPEWNDEAEGALNF